MSDRKIVSDKKIMIKGKLVQRCQGITKDTTQCERAAKRGTEFCSGCSPQLPAVGEKGENATGLATTTFDEKIKKVEKAGHLRDFEDLLVRIRAMMLEIEEKAANTSFRAEDATRIGAFIKLLTEIIEREAKVKSLDKDMLHKDQVVSIIKRVAMAINLRCQGCPKKNKVLEEVTKVSP